MSVKKDEKEVKKDLKPDLSKFQGYQLEAVIDSWKKKNPEGVFWIVWDGHIAYFKEPDIDELNCSMAAESTEKPMDSFLQLADDTFLGGSEHIFKSAKGKKALFMAMRRRYFNVQVQMGEL